MKKVIILIILCFLFNKNLHAYEKLAYDFSFKNIEDVLIELKTIKENFNNCKCCKQMWF